MSGVSPMDTDEVGSVSGPWTWVSSWCCPVTPSDSRQPLLPFSSNPLRAASERPLVILDVDQTVIHSIPYPIYLNHITQNPIRKLGIDFRVVYEEDGTDLAVSVRPGLSEFLRFVFANFRVGIWTAAKKRYAHDVLQRILTPMQYRSLAFVFTRKECAWSRSYTGPVKPVYRLLELLPNVDLSQTVLCDDNPAATEAFAENTVLVQPYDALQMNADIDQELDYLARYLERLFIDGNHRDEDVRLRHAFSRRTRAWRSSL